MIDERSSSGSGLPPGVIFQDPDQCLPAAEPVDYRHVEVQLRKALAKSEALLLQKDKLIHRQELLKEESDHRLLNDLQMTISLLSLQSRNSTNPDAASQLAAAANRVSMIARIHRRLNSYKGVRIIEFKKFLDDFCHDFSAMSSSDESPGKISVEGHEVNLPAAIAIPLGFIASELITNAAKHGKGRIAVRLKPDPKHGYALSVANDGPALPEGFAPKARGATLRATEQPIDTSTAAGKCFLDMLGVFAEFETNLRRERQLEGIADAKARGVYRGRKASIDPAKVKELQAQGMGASAIAKALKIGRASVYRALAE